MDTCTIKRCKAAAQWEITIDGHDNVRGGVTHGYCTEHVRERAGLVYEDNSKPYTVTIHGPLRPPN